LTQCPYFIFITGCAAAGKTTLAQKICKTLPIFNFSTDMFALKEVFLINDFLEDCIIKKKSDKEIKSSFLHITGSCFYWKDMLEKKIEELRTGNLTIEALDTVKTEDGGHRIRRPYLWDEVLYRSCTICNKDECYVFEFARGADLSYLEKYNIGASQVYHRCFSIIRNSNRNVTAGNSMIINIVTERRERQERNRLRRIRGDHFVSQQTMEEVYKDDIFSFEAAPEVGSFSGFLSHKFPIPVISIDNTPRSPDLNFAFVLEHVRTLVESDV